MINKEQSSRMLDVVAFLNARFLDDEMAAIAVLGLKDPDVEGVTPEEIEREAKQLSDVLLGMTDFAISAVRTLAMIAGVTPEKMIETLCLHLALMTK